MSTSVLGKERIVTLDIIRGIAILGIFLVNIINFSGNEFAVYEGSDKFIRMIFDMFVQTKFYTIFSFLFGLGFYIFMKRAEERGADIELLFVRRLVILLVFGVSHLIFLWIGDILHIYAIAGFILLAFYKRNTKTILIWALVLLFIPQLVSGLLEGSTGNLMNETNDISMNQSIEQNVQEGNTVSGSVDTPYFPFMDVNLLVFLVIRLLMIPFSILDILGMFLLGLYAGKINLFRRIPELKRKLCIIQFATLLLSIPALYAIVANYTGVEGGVTSGDVDSYFYVRLTGAMLSIFYMITIALLAEKKLWSKLLNPFRYVGQMALTNYLSQTIFSIILFSGFGLYGRISVTEGLIYSVIFYCVQMVFSKFWFKKYRFGPFEWIWRVLTYGEIHPIKINN